MAKIVKDTEHEIYGCCPCCRHGDCICDDDCDCGCKEGKECACDDDCDCGCKDGKECTCGCSCDSDSFCSCGHDCECGNYNPISLLLDEEADDADAIVIIGDNLDRVNSISKLRINKPIIAFVSDETIANNLNLVWNVKSEVISITKDWQKNTKKVKEIIENNYTFAKKYILVFDMDGALTIQLN